MSANPIAGVGETHIASNLGREGGASYWGGLLCNGRRGCFCDVITNGSIVSDTITF